MNLNLREPNAGEKITATAARQLVRAVRAARPLQGPGTRLARTPRGTVVSLAERPTAAAAKAGCWEIAAKLDGSGPEHVFANQFVLRGEVLDELEIATTIESVMPNGSYDPTDPEDGSFFVCVKVDARHPAEEQPSLVVAGDLEELAAMQQDQSFIIRPLYKLSLMLDILADLRSVPALQRVEVLS